MQIQLFSGKLKKNWDKQWERRTRSTSWNNLNSPDAAEGEDIISNMEKSKMRQGLLAGLRLK